MKRIVKRILLALAQRARQSKMLKSLLSEAPALVVAFQKSKIIGKFRDSRGNTYDLFKDLRNQIKPGWQSMVKIEKKSTPSQPDDARARILKAKNTVERMLFFLKIFGFNINGKRVLEVGCYDGSKTYALAIAGSAEVIGSDLCKYYILQKVDGSVTDSSLNKQFNNLMSLRNVLGKVVSELQSESILDLRRVRFIEDDITQSYLPSNYFDLVCSWELLEHVQNPTACFEQIYRILRYGGIAFHEYNPFFCLNGGHSLCTLDFLWGHVRLDSADFARYMNNIRPREANVALRFYKYNLNRMTLRDLRQYSNEAGLETLSQIEWPESAHLELVTRKCLDQCRTIYPNLKVSDLITPGVWVVHKKS